MTSILHLKRRRPVALRFVVASVLLALLASTMGGICSVAHLPLLPAIEKAVDQCAAAGHEDLGDASPPARDDCDRQASCLALEATEDAGALLQKSSAGVLANPFFSVLFVIALWATLHPWAPSAFLRRPPPLPKAPIAYRFCILLN